MNLSIAFVALFLASCVVSAPVFTAPPNNSDRLLIDNFVAGANLHGFIVSVSPSDAVPNFQDDIWPQNPGDSVANILGGERDLALVITQIDTVQTIVSKITGVPSSGQTFWEVATPQTVVGFSSIQWDGVDGDGDSLSATGLGPIDFTDGGNNGHVHLQLTRDISAVFTLYANSPSGLCEFILGTTGTDGQLEIFDVWIPFADFTGSCSWTQVGGFEIYIAQEANVDASLYLVAISGSQPSQTPTRTPTPTTIPLPSDSRTPTPTGTGTRTPTPVPSVTRTPTPTPTQTRTPTPTPSPECICICPAFTCALIFDPDDDVNNVYYFTGPGFTFPETNDDDDDDIDTNSLTVSVPDLSGASVLTVSIALVAVIVALF